MGVSADELAGLKCVACRGDTPAMSQEEMQSHLPVTPHWTLGSEPSHLIRQYRFDDFISAQNFAVKVGAVCEAEGHHAEITYGWGFCTVRFWTHKINGLHQNDFIMAVKVDQIKL
jgi:4a-hydroxytetrahydrobiopterin dehydratase